MTSVANGDASEVRQDFKGVPEINFQPPTFSQRFFSFSLSPTFVQDYVGQAEKREMIEYGFGDFV
ncbi:hypothetical protein LCGC14_2742960, partial [marine sediment metagenome]